MSVPSTSPLLFAVKHALLNGYRLIDNDFGAIIYSPDGFQAFTLSDSSFELIKTFLHFRQVVLADGIEWVIVR